MNINYNDRTWTSMIITMFLVKFLVSFILIFTFLGFNNAFYLMDNPEAIHGSAVLDKTNVDNDGLKIDYGEITLAGIPETTGTFDRVKGMTKFAFSSSVLDDFFELRFGLVIPAIVWFFLVDIWTWLLLPVMFIRIFVKG